MTDRGRFIVIEGGDGVGKTTIAGLLGDATYPELLEDEVQGAIGVRSPRLVFVSRRQVSLTSGYSRRLMDLVATALWHSGDSTDLPDSFWLSLQASWFTAHGSTVLEPLLARGTDVIVDGWLYKLWSKLLSQGYTLTELEVMFGRVMHPDQVVLLDANAAVLYDRKERAFRPSELGMHAGFTDLSRTSFVEYQDAGLANLRDFAQRYGWKTVVVSAEEAARVTSERVRECLELPPRALADTGSVAHPGGGR